MRLEGDQPGSKPRKVPQSLQHKIDSQGGKDAAMITKIVSTRAAALRRPRSRRR